MKNQTFTYLGDGMQGTCLVSADETAQTLSLFHIVATHGACVPPHVHHNEDEAFYILSGTFELQIGERRVTAGPGCSGFGPRGVPHSFVCTSEQGELVVMALPGGFEAFFTELEAFGPLPTPPTSADIERFFGLLGRFGMTPASPLPESTPVEVLVRPNLPGFDAGNHQGYPLILSEETDGALLLLDVKSVYGGGVPRHLHNHEDETFYILEGRFTVERGDETICLGPGECAFGPRGVNHSWHCDSPEGGRLLVYVTPGSNFQAFATTMGREVPANPTALTRLADQFGITML